jgi:16S rRNA pseudouridine516 synthase
MKYPVRLEKFISHATGLARSDVKKKLRTGTISVNDKVVKGLGFSVNEHDVVTYGGQAIRPQPLSYFMMNKPAGYVSNQDDANHPSAMSLIAGHFNPPLHCAGRLDADTTGLLLLTNDGQWSHQVASPNRDKSKVYIVQLAEPISDSELEPLRVGILLNNEDKPTRAATATLRSETSVELAITEGKYHQVKRMFAAIGHHVSDLHRAQIGSLLLEPELTPGSFRPLTTDEIGELGVPSDN